MAEIFLDRCGNWYGLLIWPEGKGPYKPRFIAADAKILAYCDLDTDSKNWHLKQWQSRHERLARRMAKMLVTS